MQYVKFKRGSMEEARHGNERDYYLVSISGQYANIKWHDGDRWCSLCVPVITLEPAIPEIQLPVDVIENEYYP